MVLGRFIQRNNVSHRSLFVIVWIKIKYVMEFININTFVFLLSYIMHIIGLIIIIIKEVIQ